MLGFLGTLCTWRPEIEDAINRYLVKTRLF